MLDCSSLMLFLVYVCSALTLVFVAVLFVTCIQWQFFFKRQTTVIRVLPTSQQESLIKVCVVCLFVFVCLGEVLMVKIERFCYNR